MLNVVECVTVHHDHKIVAYSAAIILFGMLSLFHLLVRAEESTLPRRRNWIVVAAFTAGGSIWATHFVAMLAYRGTVPIGFDFLTTAVSAIVAVFGVWAALNIKRTGWLATLATALALTSTVAAMHFIGMEGMQVAAQIQYETVSLISGAVIALFCFFISLFLFQRFQWIWRIVLPAFAAILAVCALHFTSMAATTLVPDPTLVAPDEAGFGRGSLTGAISGVTVLLLIVVAVAAFIDRYLVDLKGFADATLDGLAITRENRIIEVNARFAALMERTEASLIGEDANQLIAANDGLATCIPRPLAIDATPLSGNKNRIFELGVHTIEYRGRPSEVLAVRDLTEKRAAQREVEYLARHDTLTGLANRVAFREKLALQIVASREKKAAFAVLALDLDRFKAVNDLFGHAEGDRVLKDVADILQSCSRPGDLAARLGGDEFAIVTRSDTDDTTVEQIAESILEVFREKMDSSVDPTAVGVSIGIAVFPKDGADGEELTHAADVALYRSKTNGRGVLAFYDLAMDEENKTRRRAEADLRRAVGHGELRLLYQPVFSSDRAELVGYEAMVRWSHPTRGDLAQEQFMSLAEETGIVISLGEWTLRQACRAASQWNSDLKVAVNISPAQFKLTNLAFVVCNVLTETGLPPARLELEVTETALIRDRAATLTTLHQLKALGVSIVMDDFGTGYSSLGNLRSFPFDKIKIDRSFVTAMKDDENAKAIVKAVVGIGRSLALPVTAEGIETEDQYKMVINEGCTQVQGIFCGPADAAPENMHLSKLTGG